MEWAKALGTPSVNLSRSGMPALAASDLGLDPGDFSINGDHPYGYPPLVEAVAAKAGASPDNVIITAGASQAIFLTGLALLDPGDRVVIEKPAYEPLLSVPRALGAEILRLERTLETGFELDLDRLDEALRARPRAVFLTNLHNPSGALIPRERLAAAAERAARAGSVLFVDEVYLEFLQGESGRTAFGLGDNIIVASSLTKAFGLAGLRCGWMLAPRPLIPLLKRIVDHVFVEHVFIAEQMAAAVFPLLDGLRRRNNAGLAENRRTVREFLDGEPRLEWVRPAGGIVCFPRLRGPRTGDELAEILARRHGISIVPGRFFEDGRHFRLGFGISPEALAKGLDAVGRALDE
jgi:hypothetical protein